VSGVCFIGPAQSTGEQRRCEGDFQKMLHQGISQFAGKRPVSEASGFDMPKKCILVPSMTPWIRS
jgi:hypothetical protein